MRLRRTQPWLLVLILLAVVGQAGAQTAPPLASLVDRLQGLFPKIEGEVVEARGPRVTLSLGKRDGLQAGVEMNVVREGRELRHPKTGQVLGRAEEDVARIVVSEVQEQYAIATVVRGADGSSTADVRTGDHVRVSAGKIPLTLLPLSSGVKDAQIEAIVQELTDALNRTGRFQLLMGDAIGVRLAESGIKPEEALEGKGLQPGPGRPAFEYLLAVLVKRVQNRPYMDVRLFSSSGSTPLMTTAMFVPSSIKPAPRDRFSSDPKSRPEPVSKPRSFLARLLGGELEAGSYSSGEGTIPLTEVARLGFPVLAMDVSVSPKDGIPRVVLSDGDRVFQYRLVNQAFEPDWTFTARGFGTIVSVQLVDLDGDGIFEVAVNRWHPKVQLSSFVITAKNGQPKELVDVGRTILFAVDDKGDGVKRSLWGQRMSQETFFTFGQAHQVNMKDGKVVSERDVRVPSAFRATGATFAKIDKERRVLAFIDEHNRLQIASPEGVDLWRSGSQVGGGGAIIELVRAGGNNVADRSYFFKMEPIPLAIDLDGDGIDEIVVPQNTVREGLLAVVFKGAAGYRLQSLNSGFEGVITALGGFKADDAAQPTLVAAVVRYNSFIFKRGGETQIIMTTSE